MQWKPPARSCAQSRATVLYAGAVHWCARVAFYARAFTVSRKSITTNCCCCSSIPSKMYYSPKSVALVPSKSLLAALERALAQLKDTCRERCRALYDKIVRPFALSTFAHILRKYTASIKSQTIARAHLACAIVYRSAHFCCFLFASHRSALLTSFILFIVTLFYL